MKGSNYFFR